MNDFPARSRRQSGLLLLLALLLTGMGLVSALWSPDGYTDALFEPDFTIQHVPPDGVLAEAGFQQGDSVITVEGIAVETLGMYSRWPRSLARAPGETLTMTVQRDGSLVTGAIVFRERPEGIVKMRLGLLLVLLAFLWAGVWAFLAIPSPHSGCLAAIGVAAGLAIPPPPLGRWNGWADHVNVAAEVLWIILLLRFLLFFPKPKRIAQAHLTTVLIYAPWVVLVGCLLVELLFHPRFYHSFGGLIGVLLFGYLVLTLVALIHSWVKTPGGKVWASGLGWVLVGFAAGFGGLLLWVVDALLLTGFDIPGTNWAPVLFGVIPIGLALGIRKSVGEGA